MSYTRELIGDSSTAPKPLFTDARIKDTLNDVYREAVELARGSGLNLGNKRVYADSVADQAFYQLPSDLMRIITVELARDGSDLSGTGTPTFLSPTATDVGMNFLENDSLSSVDLFFMHGSHLGIVDPPALSGTSSIRLTYEGAIADLVQDTDEPVIPVPFHAWLCAEAGLLLMMSMSLDASFLAMLAGRKRALFERWVSDRVFDPNGQFSVSGLNPDTSLTNTGKTFTGE